MLMFVLLGAALSVAGCASPPGGSCYDATNPTCQNLSIFEKIARNYQHAWSPQGMQENVGNAMASAAQGRTYTHTIESPYGKTRYETYCHSGNCETKVTQ